MRKVIIKIWIPIEWVNPGTINRRSVPGTGCWSKDFIQMGYFHGWGNAALESENTVASYTVALVELADGTITNVEPSNLKFTEAPGKELTDLRAKQ